MRNLQYRMLVILVVLVLSIVLAYPPSEKIKLGLDLRGGIHLVLQVPYDKAIESEVGQFRDRIEADLEEKEVIFTDAINRGLKIQISGVSHDQTAEVEDYLGTYRGSWNHRSEFTDEGVDFVLEMAGAYYKLLANQMVRQARAIIQNRVDQYGVAEPTIVVYGSGDIQDQIIVELPGVDDPNRVIKSITTEAKLELKLVHPVKGGPYPSREVARQAFSGVLPSDYEVLPYSNPDETDGTAYMVVRRAPSITGKQLKNARRSEDSFSGRSQVLFFLNSEGVKRFTRTTAQNVGNRLAIVLDERIRSAPNISERISSESAQITGAFTLEQAEDLALILRSGALPARLRVLENRTVGPSLGIDSIRKGIQASALGLTLVVFGMLVVYRFSGFNAIFCLALNLLILMGALAWFRATLTLPGIAGIILIIGMAVDANILIFERIKEELSLGKTVRSAVDAGFGRVFTTIIDTNITTLVAALFLFQFGTGPIRGFAVTLAVGLLANIFTATFVSRTVFSLFLQQKKAVKISI